MSGSVGFPYGFSRLGRTRVPDAESRIKELVEMLLFTRPGERPFRPQLGTPLAGLVFEGLNDALAAALQTSIQAALQQWLGELLEVREVRVDAVDATLQVEVVYVPAYATEPRRVQFRRARV